VRASIGNRLRAGLGEALRCFFTRGRDATRLRKVGADTEVICLAAWSWVNYVRHPDFKKLHSSFQEVEFIKWLYG
jgi:hypothetical protein